jgi:hypothetical protein
MQYAKVTLTVAYEDYGVSAFTPLDDIIPLLREELPTEVVVLDFDEHPMKLIRDYSGEKVNQ